MSRSSSSIQKASLTADQLLKVLKLSPHPVNKRDLARALHIKGVAEKQYLKQLLKELVQQGTIHKQSSKTFSLPQHRVPEVIVVQVLEIGSVDEEDIFVTPISQKGTALPKRIRLEPFRGKAPLVGESLLVRLIFTADKPKAKLLKRLENTLTQQFVGVVHKTRTGYVLLSCDRRDKKSYALTGDLPFKTGDLVLAEVPLSSDRVVTGKSARTIKIIGSQDDPKAVSLIALYQNQIPHVFTPDILAEASTQAALPLGPREDLTSFALVTIDGEDARDFDDAVWAEPDPAVGTPEHPGWHLLVAIADVSFYVGPQTALDLEAQKRGNSVYFPDQVIPMLPEALSNGSCSLVPHEKRACLAVHLWIDEKGQLKKHRFVRGVMKSHARLTYTQVQCALDGEPDIITKSLLPLIEPLFHAFEVLKKAREKRGTLDLDLPEYKVRFSEKGEVNGIIPQQRFASHQLIEEFMILANVAAAITLEQKQAPCLYRVHESPPAEKIEAFAEVLKGLGIPFAKGQVITAKSFNHILEYSKKTPFQGIVNELVLRSQSQACYTPRNLGHFGLSLPRYAHFTSPIRRYADLVVHRSLVRTLGLGEKELEEDSEDLEALGDHLSDTERRAATAEREANSRYVALFLEKHVGETFQGRITGVANFGFFVALDNTGAEGLIPVALLRRDYYDFDPQKHCLTGRRTHKTYTLGDVISVHLTEINPLTNTITFQPIG